MWLQECPLWAWDGTKGLACIRQCLGIGYAQHVFRATGISKAASAIEAAGQDCKPLWLCLVTDRRGVAPGLT